MKKIWLALLFLSPWGRAAAAEPPVVASKSYVDSGLALKADEAEIPEKVSVNISGFASGSGDAEFNADGLAAINITTTGKSSAPIAGSEENMAYIRKQNGIDGWFRIASFGATYTNTLEMQMRFGMQVSMDFLCPFRAGENRAYTGTRIVKSGADYSGGAWSRLVVKIMDKGTQFDVWIYLPGPYWHGQVKFILTGESPGSITTYNISDSSTVTTGSADPETLSAPGYTGKITGMVATGASFNTMTGISCTRAAL